jgi:hypothetical protein
MRFNESLLSRTKCCRKIENRFGKHLTGVENDGANKQQKALLQTRALLQNTFYDGHVTTYTSKILSGQFGQNHHI